MDDVAQADLPFITERRAILLGLLALPTAAQSAGTPDRSYYRESFAAFRGKSLEQRVQELGDREEIKELTARYAHSVARGVSAAGLFTDDGTFIVRHTGQPAQEIRGRKALDDYFGRVVGSPNPSLPMIHNHVIRIDRDEAIGTCSLEVRGTQNGKSMIGSGYYDDRFRRQNGEWKFVVRDVTLFHNVPIQEGWAPHS